MIDFKSTNDMLIKIQKLIEKQTKIELRNKKIKSLWQEK